MNNVLLKVRIDAAAASYTNDGTLFVQGSCSFKFYDSKENKARPLAFQAYGQTAVSLNQSGVGGVHIISGRLNVYKPNPKNPNHQCLLTIERNICINSGASANRVVPMQQPPATTAAVTPKATVGATTASVASVRNSGATTVELYEDDIPF